jgi:hypothetical protein
MREPNYSILAKLNPLTNSSSQNSIAGQVFDRWTIYGFVGSKRGNNHWLCRCSCGNWGIVGQYQLSTARSKSCGCLRHDTKPSLTHGMTNTSVFSRWTDMHTRCYNENNPAYRNYGGRGIIVEERWHDFTNFFADMGHPPTPEHEIERVNNNENYGPENCIWDTILNQARNKRTNIYLTLNGITRCAAEWGHLLGIPRDTIYGRYHKGLSDIECLAVKEQ